MEERIINVWFEDGYIKVMTDGGAVLSQPLEAFPALFCASPAERNQYYVWDEGHSIRWPELDEDIHISHFHEVEKVNYDNEVNRLLSRFPWLDMKEAADYIGMHWTKLARFRYGVWAPSAETFSRIKAGIVAMGQEMIAAAL